MYRTRKKLRKAAAFSMEVEVKGHKPGCVLQPSSCSCPGGIWAQMPGPFPSDRNGKWLLFPANEDVDKTWEQVKTLLAANELGPSAKVEGDGKSFVICVHTEDYENVPDVFRVLIALVRNNVRDSNNNFQYKTNKASQEAIYCSDEAARRSRHDRSKKEPGKRSTMYNSPKSTINESIQLFKNNIGPRNESVLVAELRKEAEGRDAQIVYHDSPILRN